MLHAVYCHMFCALGIATLHIVYCVLPFVCTVGIALLCTCMLYCHVLCAMGSAASCIACDVLVPQILLHCASRHGYFLLMLCLCASLLYVTIDHGAANDCTDVISLVYILLISQGCKKQFSIGLVFILQYIAWVITLATMAIYICSYKLCKTVKSMKIVKRLAS